MRNDIWRGRLKSAGSLRKSFSIPTSLRRFRFSRSSVYQDVPLHSLEDFQRLAPEEARNDSVMENEHQLMLNRLSFELAERQRYATNPMDWDVLHELISGGRLDLKRKELIQAKEEMIKESKTKATTMENVKAQIDTLVKVKPSWPSSVRRDSTCSSDCFRNTEESGRTCPTSFYCRFYIHKLKETLVLILQSKSHSIADDRGLWRHLVPPAPSFYRIRETKWRRGKRGKIISAEGGRDECCE